MRVLVVFMLGIAFVIGGIVLALQAASIITSLRDVVLNAIPPYINGTVVPLEEIRKSFSDAYAIAAGFCVGGCLLSAFGAFIIAKLVTAARQQVQIVPVPVPRYVEPYIVSVISSTDEVMRIMLQSVPPTALQRMYPAYRPPR